MIIRPLTRATLRNSTNLNAPEPHWKTKLLRKLDLRTATIAALLALFGAYLIATIYVRYVADDFCWELDVQQMGLGAVANFYQTLTGTVTNFAVAAVILQLQSNHPNGMWMALTLLLWLIALYVFLRYFLPKDALIVSLILLVALLDTAPQIGQSFYWQVGIKYSLSMIFLIVLAWWIFTRSDRFTGWLGAALLAFLSMTSSEAFALILFVPLGIIFWKIPSARRKSLAGFSGAAIGLGLMLVAPGTAWRFSAFHRLSLMTDVYYSVIRAGTPYEDSLRHGPFILVIIVTLLVCVGGMSRETASENRISGRDQTRTILEVLLVIVGINIICEFTAFYATGAELVGRAEIIPIGLTLAGVAAISLQIKRPNWLQSQRLVAIVFVAFVAVSIVRVGGFIGEISNDAAQWDARDQALRAGGQLVQTVRYFDMADIETDWANGCIRNYYGIKSS